MTFDLVLVDDHQVTRLGLKTLLERGGHRVVGEGGSVREALAVCRSCRFDVLVLDLRLGEASGLDVVEGLAARARVLVLTGLGGLEGAARRARSLGVLGFLKKDAPPERLLSAVAQVARGVEVVDEAVREAWAASDPDALTPRELEVLQVVARGASNLEVAQRLGLKEGTVRIHLSNVFSKLGVRDRTEAVTAALKRGLVDL